MLPLISLHEYYTIPGDQQWERVLSRLATKYIHGGKNGQITTLPQF